MAKRPSVEEILEAARRGTPVPAQAETPRPEPPPPPTPTTASPTEAPPRLSLQEKLEKAEAERTARIAAREGGAAPSESTGSDKPSIREKLERARAAHPIRNVAPRDAGPDDEEIEEAEPAPTVASKETSPPAKPAAPPAAAVSKKPMSMAEKLAAARGNAPAPVEAKVDAPAPAAAAVSKKPMSMAEKLAAARGNAPAPVEAKVDAPAPAAAAVSKKPMSMAEKLAAARGNAPAPVEAKVAEVAVAAAPVAAPADRESPPTAEITDAKDLAEALRRTGTKKDQEAASRPAGPGPAGPRPPYSPAARPEPAPIETPPSSQIRFDRRGFMVFVSWTTIAFTALVAALLLLSWMMVRFLFPNAEAEPPSTVKVGRPADYEPGEVSERYKDRWGFWVVREEDEHGRDVIYALQTYCTHLGCPPTWLAGEQKFKCPCHGSGFYKDGVNFEGPAPRPLERYKIALADDGQIVVDKAQSFRKDLDQWSDPDSYLAV